MPRKKKGTYQGKAESPTLGQQKLPCNCVTKPLAPTTRCVTNPLAPTTCCLFWPNKYLKELGLRDFLSSHPWWGREALARVSNKFPYCKLHCFEESSFPTRDSDYGQNRAKAQLPKFTQGNMRFVNGAATWVKDTLTLSSFFTNVSMIYLLTYLFPQMILGDVHKMDLWIRGKWIQNYVLGLGTSQMGWIKVEEVKGRQKSNIDP